MVEQLGVSKKKVKRGARIVMSNEMFSDMLNEYLGLEQGTIEIWHVTNQHHMRSVEISFTSDDERLPVLTEGAVFPEIYTFIEVETSVESTTGKVSKKGKLRLFGDAV